MRSEALSRADGGAKRSAARRASEFFQNGFTFRENCGIIIWSISAPAEIRYCNRKEGCHLATIYTDEAREPRYARLRAKKRRCEKALDWMMWITLLVAAFDLIPGFVSGILNGLLGGNIGAFVGFLFSVISAAAAVYAIYAKKWLHTVGAMLVIALSSAIGAMVSGGMVISSGYIVLLIPVLLIDKFWADLEKEEGFPLFDISYAERDERRRNQEKLTEARALKAGYRIASAERQSEMADLLDREGDVPVMAAHPHGYQERFYGSAAAERPAQAFQAGIMDTLEEIGAEPQAPAAAPAAGQTDLPVLGAMDHLPVKPGRADTAAGSDILSDSSADDILSAGRKLDPIQN